MSDYVLDGTEDVQHHAYDAHEQVVRAPNPAGFAEYPKAVDHKDNPYGYGKEPVVVNSAKEEAAYHAANAPAPVVETKHYTDGSSATGVAPLPDQSPAQQAATAPKEKA